MTRLTRAWSALKSEQRLAGIAALLLFVAMFLPWYQQNAVVNADGGAGEPQPERLRGLLVRRGRGPAGRAAVLFLLFARAEGRSFHLPGSDGTIVISPAAGRRCCSSGGCSTSPGISQPVESPPTSASSGGSSSRSPPPGCSPTPARGCAPPQQPEPPPRAPPPSTPGRAAVTIAAEPTRRRRAARRAERPRAPTSAGAAVATVAPAGSPRRGADPSGAETEQLSFDDHDRPEPDCSLRHGGQQRRGARPSARSPAGSPARLEMCPNTSFKKPAPSPQMLRRDGDVDSRAVRRLSFPDDGRLPHPSLAHRPSRTSPQGLRAVGYLPGESTALVSYLADQARQAGARRGARGRRQDRAGQGAEPLSRARAGAPAVLRGPRRGQGAVRVELPQAAAAHPGRGDRRRLGATSRTTSSARSSCSRGR